MSFGKIKTYFACLLVFFALSGCIERFNYTPNETGPPLLVIDGGITNQHAKQILRLSWSTRYGLVPFVPNTGAFVTIFENGVVVDTCMEISDGLYQIDGDIMKPQPGNQYSVEVKTSEGKIYRSEPEVMPYPVKPDSAYMEMERRPVRNDAGAYVTKWNINIYIDTPVRSQKSFSYLRWRVSEAYSFHEAGSGPFAHPKSCYIQEDPSYQEIQLFNGADLSGGHLGHKLVSTRQPYPIYEFLFLHYFNVFQYTITQKAFEYWTRLKMVANPTGSFMDTPPAAIMGNVYNVDDKDEVVLGYFEVSSVEILRHKTYQPDLLPFYIIDPCEHYPYADYCFNCLSLPNSSLIRPSYW